MRRGMKMCEQRWMAAVVGAAIVAVSLTRGVSGQTAYVEQEPNDTPATATVVTPFVVGDSVTGATRGTTTSGSNELTADFLALWLAPGPGINRVELTLTHPQAAQMNWSVRGISQASGVLYPALPMEVVGTTLATPTTRTARVYVSGGAPAKLLVRVTGRSTTTADYTITMTSVPVTAQQISGLYPGTMTFTTVGQGYSTDTELWLCDASGYPIPGWGNDDTAPPLFASPRSTLRRTLPAGRYFLAISDSDLAVSEPNPSDDGNRSRPATEDRGIVVGTSATVNVPLTFNISAPLGGGSPPMSLRVPATKTLVNQVLWYELLVGISSGCSVADVAGGSDGGPDGVLDGGDFIAFINAFAGGEALADIVSGSGEPPGDGVVDGNDFIAFINAFAAGC